MTKKFCLETLKKCPGSLHFPLLSSSGLTRERGITESTRQFWLGRMHRCADIHNAMREITGAYYNNSE